jgi:hypothetical protein
MKDILVAVKDTPLPTILVIAGIMFLLLSIANQLVGKIAVPPERQRWAGAIGGVLLVLGIALNFIPGSTLKNDPQPIVPSSGVHRDYFSVVGSFNDLNEARDFASKVSERQKKYPVEIYRSENGKYGVTLGGNLDDQEAMNRVHFAKDFGISGAYVRESSNWRGNLNR